MEYDVCALTLHDRVACENPRARVPRQGKILFKTQAHMGIFNLFYKNPKKNSKIEQTLKSFHSFLIPFQPKLPPHHPPTTSFCVLHCRLAFILGLLLLRSALMSLSFEKKKKLSTYNILTSNLYLTGKLRAI